MPVSHENRYRRRRHAVLPVVALLTVVLFIGACSTSVSDESGSDRSGSTSVLDELSRDASSAERIDAALQAGEIDEETATLYHVWAQFGDPGLPTEFRGAPAPHDIGVLTAAGESLDDLPGDIRAKVAPYFKRPSDPQSAFSLADGESTGTSGRGRAAAAGEEPNRCASEWISDTVPDLPLRVWACPDVGEDHATAVIDETVEALTRFASPMFADAPDGLGTPIPDDPDAHDHPDSDERIDLYALPDGWMAPYRDGNERQLGDAASAATMRAAPQTGTTSSAYVVYRTDPDQSPLLLAYTLVHELFHVQQFSHYGHLAGLADGSAWAYDAFANWASVKWVQRELDAEDRGTYRPSALQDSPLSIHDDDWQHGYQAYLFALFIEQEAGAETIFDLWESVGSTPTGEPGGAMINALGERMDLEEAFPEFAMRLFNADLPGDPIEPRLGEVLPGLADGLMPDMTPESLGDEPVEFDLADVPGLGYRYRQVATDASQQVPVTVEISTDLEVPSGATVSVEALVPGPDGDYTREVVDADGAEFCVSDDIYLVVANTSVVIDDTTSGSVTVTPTDDDGCDPSSSPTTSAPPTSTTVSCDGTAGWDTGAETAEIGLNAPIVSVTGDGDECTDEVRIGLDDDAGAPGYRVEYVDVVSRPGSGDPVPVAGDHALSVVIDSPTYDPASGDFAPTVATSDDMVDTSGFDVVRQVAHGGSFEGMTTFAIGVDGERPFTVDVEGTTLVIRIAGSG